MNRFDSKYTFLCKIGEGTFSDVLKCRQESTGIWVAVKTLKKKYNSSAEVIKLTELNALRTLPPHPNVVPLIEYIYEPDAGTVYMVFELMDMNLYELIRSRTVRMTEAKAKRMFYQILKGAEHLHSHDIFHRDIKPENVLVRRSTVKLSDLGSVRSVHSRQPYTEYISTRWYRSPETMLTGGVYGPKMDVWALGCVFYEMLTTRPLFPGESELDQLTRIHRVVGSPGGRLLAKMGRSGKRSPFEFARFPAMSLAHLLPFASDSARDVLKHAIVYDPDLRASVRRLLGHRYFAELRDGDADADAGRAPAAAAARRHRSSPALASVAAAPPPPIGLGARRPSQLKNAKPALKTSSWAPASSAKPTAQLQKKRTISSNQCTIPRLRPARENKPLIDPLPKPTVTVKHLDPLKLNKVKANKVSILQELHSIPAKRVISHRSLMGSDFRGRTKHLLPPIPEH